MSGVRLLRGALLLLALGVVGSVVWTLRRPSARVAGPSVEREQQQPPAPSSSPGQAPTRMGDVVYRNVKGGRETFLLRAKQLSGREQEQLQLEQVEAEFSYVAQGEPGKGRIRSDRCTYLPAGQEARFEGNVRLDTDDGMRLASEELVYLGADGGARSERPVEFERRQLSGSARRMDYETLGSRLRLEGDVVVRGKGAGAFEITSARAAFDLEQGEARFEEDVVLTRSGDELRASALVLYGGKNDIDRARAAGDVSLRSTSDALPGLRKGAGAPSRGGLRTLRCQQLELNLRPDRTLEEAVARDEAELVLLPGPGEPREKRTLRGAVLAFRWDEQERLTEVQGQRQAEFVGEPLPPATGLARRVSSRNFLVVLDPATGAARSAEFKRDVLFERGSQEARAERGSYDGGLAQLTLTEEPSLVDLEQGSRLEAGIIEVMTRSGDVRARLSVRHTIERRRGREAAIPGSDAERSVISARLFEYDAAERTARYREGALLRSGRSELRAAEIRRVDAAPERRRLDAEGDVVSLFYARARPGEREPAPLDGRARAMSYDEAERRAVYRGDVVLVQGEVRTKSPEAVLLLAEGSGELRRLEAFDPVELRQGTRIATGERAVYTPADRTIVVTGNKVELTDDNQQAHGRSLTFFVGEDRILVDGREEARTETILRRKP